MLAQQFGHLIKDRRARKGLTQMALARSARVSRTVLSRLEQGNARAVQTDVLDRILAVLDVHAGVVDATAAHDPRVQARLEHQRRRTQRREAHLRLAIVLSGDASTAADMIAKARERVRLWKRKSSCSPFYIERWSKLLALPPRKLAQAMVSLGEWEDALFQNSPWSWAWN